MLAKLGGASVTALSLLGLPAAAHAQAGKLPVHVTGGADCGLWSAARQQHGSDILEQYVVGMLDGLSSGADREFWQVDGRAISWDAAYFWIDGYCRAHPTDFLNTATMRLFEERRRGATQCGSRRVKRAVKGEGPAPKKGDFTQHRIALLRAFHE
jgi:hypothetical protein